MDHPARRFLLYHGVLNVEGTAFDTFLDRDQALHLGEPWELGQERIPADNWCFYVPIPLPSSPELASVWTPSDGRYAPRLFLNEKGDPCSKTGGPVVTHAHEREALAALWQAYLLLS